MDRQVLLAKRLLESKGYEVKLLNESAEVLLPGTIIRFRYGLNGTAEIVRHHKGEYYFIKYEGDEEKLFKLEPGDYSIVYEK